MSEFKAKVTAELDTSSIQSELNKIGQNKLKLSVDTTKLRSQIEKSLKSPFKIKVTQDSSNKSAKSKLPNNASSVRLTNAQLAQVETARRKSQIRTSEFEKKSNARVQEAKLKDINKLETAQKTSDIRVREAQQKQEIRDASWREKQRVAEEKRIQKEREKIRERTDPDLAHERVYGGTYKNAYDHSLANGRSVKSAEKAGLSAVQAQKMHEFGDALEDVTRAGTRYVALPIAAATVASVKAFMDYETAFTGVRKTVDGTEAELQAVSDGLEQMALRVPVASTELAHIAQLGGQLGIPTKELLKFTETVAALEVSTNLQGEEGASTLARFMNVVNEDYGNIDRVGAAIVDLGNHFATTESEIATMSQRLGATGSIIGMSTSDILGYAAALSATGVKAEAGGSAMSRVWQDISQAVSEGGEGLNAYAKVSKKTAAEFAATWKGSPTEAFNDLLKGLKESPDMIKALDDIGVNNVRDIRALQNLANRYDLVEDALGRANTAYKENTALSNEANRAYSTTASKLQLAKESITQAGRSIGEAVAPTVIDFAGGVQKAATGFANLGDGSKKAIVSFSLLTAGTIAGANGLAKMVKTGATLKQGFGVLKTAIAPLATKLLPGLAGKAGLAGLGSSALAATGPILGVGAAIAAIGVAAYKAKKHSDNLKMGATLKKEANDVKEHADRIVKLQNLMSEVKSLDLVINNPKSSQEQIDQAKQRIQEIADLLEKEYNLKVTADTTEIEKAGILLTKTETNKMITEASDYLSTLDIADYSKSKNNLKSYEQKYDALIQGQADLSYLQAAQDYVLSITDPKKRISEQYKFDLEKKKIFSKFKESGDKDLIEAANYYEAVPEAYIESSFLDPALKKAKKKVDTANTTIDSVESSVREQVDSLAQALASSQISGDSRTANLSADVLENYGKKLQGVGYNTDYLAQKYAIAKQGATDFNQAIQDGKLDSVVEEYVGFKKAIGDTTDNAVRGAALLKQGFTEAAQVTSENMSAVYTDMKKLGEENGVEDAVKNAITGTAVFASGFNTVEEIMNSGSEGVNKFLTNANKLYELEGIFTDDMGAKEKSQQLTELAHSLNLIPSGKSVKIDVDTGEASVITDVTKSLNETWGNGDKTLNVTVNTDVEGDNIDDFQNKVDSLNNKDCKVTFNADGTPARAVIDGVKHDLVDYDQTTGTATLVAEGGDAVGTIDLVHGKIELLPNRKVISIEANAEGTSGIDEYASIIDELSNYGDVSFRVDVDGNTEVLNEAGKVIAELQKNENISFRINAEGDLEVINTLTGEIQTLGRDGTVIDVGFRVENIGVIEDAEGEFTKFEGKECTVTLSADNTPLTAKIGESNFLIEGYDDTTKTATLVAENGQAVAIIDITNKKIECLPEEKQITITTDGSAIDGLNKVSQLIGELKGKGNLKFKINADTGGIDILNSAGELISNLKSDPSIDISINADTGNLEIFDNLTNQTYTINYKTGEIEPVAPQEGAVNYKKTSQEKPNDETAGVGYQKTGQQNPDNKTAGVNYKKGSQAPPTDASAKVNYLLGSVAKPIGLVVQGTINWVTGAVQKLFGGGVDGTAHVEGTAFSQGTAKKGKAFKSGHWGTKSSGVALGGELGEELVVNNTMPLYAVMHRTNFI